MKREKTRAEGAPEQAAENAPKKSALRAFLSLILKLALVAAIGWAALTFVFGVFRLSGNNMYPALKDGDLCVTYRLDPYASDDVVAYLAHGGIRFGRIVARVGDTVDGDEQGLLVNGTYRSEEVFYPTEILDTALELPLTLGEGQYVVLNDHRTEQSDSRSYGVIREEDLQGKVIFIFRRRGF